MRAGAEGSRAGGHEAAELPAQARPVGFAGALSAGQPEGAFVEALSLLAAIDGGLVIAPFLEGADALEVASSQEERTLVHLLGPHDSKAATRAVACPQE